MELINSNEVVERYTFYLISVTEYIFNRGPTRLKLWSIFSLHLRDFPAIKIHSQNQYEIVLHENVFLLMKAQFCQIFTIVTKGYHLGKEINPYEIFTFDFIYELDISYMKFFSFT